MRNEHYMTWNMSRKLKNMENETQTLYDLGHRVPGGYDLVLLDPSYLDLTRNLKTWKMRITHCKTWNIAKER